MKRIFLRRLGIMLLVVMPTLSVAVALSFWLYPGEIAGFRELWLNSIILVMLGPSVLGVALILAHDALLGRIVDRFPIGTRSGSIIVGGGLGLAFGAAWSLVVFWGVGVTLLGLFAGALYGLLSPVERMTE